MRRTILMATAVPVLALALALVVNLPKKLIYNVSASAPIGLYWIDQRPVERGDFVLSHVPGRLRNLVIERGYLPPDVPLIKRVIGLNGDRICRLGSEITANGTVVAKAKKHDGSGRSMPIWQGCRVLEADEVFLLQDHPHSFDGRYFGPVDRRLIIGRATRMRLP